MVSWVCPSERFLDPPPGPSPPLLSILYVTKISIYLLLFRVRLVKTLSGPSAAARTG